MKPVTLFCNECGLENVLPRSQVHVEANEAGNSYWFLCLAAHRSTTLLPPGEDIVEQLNLILDEFAQHGHEVWTMRCQWCERIQQLEIKRDVVLKEAAERGQYSYLTYECFDCNQQRHFIINGRFQQLFLLALRQQEVEEQLWAPIPDRVLLGATHLLDKILEEWQEIFLPR